MSKRRHHGVPCSPLLNSEQINLLNGVPFQILRSPDPTGTGPVFFRDPLAFTDDIPDEGA